MLWDTQEIGAGAVQGVVRAGGGDTSKSPSAATDKAGARGHHGARPTKRGKGSSVGKYVRQNLRSVGRRRGPRGLWSGP